MPHATHKSNKNSNVSGRKKRKGKEERKEKEKTAWHSNSMLYQLLDINRPFSLS